jgi:hypothetical protein
MDKALLRKFLEKFQSAGRIVLAWTLRHKYAAIAVVIVFGFFLWPKSSPNIKGVDPSMETTPRVTALAVSSTTRLSATQPASTQQYAGDLALYAPDQDGADPSWSLPTELKADDLQRLAHQVETLARDIPATAQLEQQCSEGVTQLYDAKIVGLFWSRLIGDGFQDKNLPLDWYQVVKERNSILGNLSAGTEMFANQMVQAVIAMRLSSVQVRIIGGNVVVGDMLFIKASQQYIDQRKPFFEKLLPLIQGVTQRTRQEFQSELNANQ